MFDYLSGRVAAVAAGHVVIDVGGVGFEVIADAQTLGSVHMGEQCRLYTLLRLSDERLILYGFLEERQRDLFLKLTAVSGVGPKLAIAVLSALNPDALVSAVVTEDAQAFQAVPGVGRKTAQRLLLELREKVDFSEAGDLAEAAASLLAAGAQDAASQAVEALEGLGYGHAEAIKAVAAVRSLGDTPEELVKFALKRFGPKG
ncbi:MAG: Holliday junction branch migration protein RuvA [Clostridia bacterium]|nr:Holliday junction branch migration protein RuvA [Clostridia bacterium]